MGWKHQKLLSNLGNAIEAAAGPEARGGDLHERARAEALACYAAAGVVLPTREEEAERRAALSSVRPVAGEQRRGGSSWQSLARGAGSIEADWLNGEIALLGRLHGVPTPVNSGLQRVANRLAREQREPGSLTLEALAAEIADATHPQPRS
jgi:2-dehydropantoate 2-reductase